MNVYQIYMDIKAHGLEIAIVVGVIMKFIEISPVKLNPWTAVKKACQKILNGAINDRIDELVKAIDTQKQEIVEMKKDLNEERAKTARYRIIRFDDEMTHGTIHSDDHKEQIMEDIATYEIFCNERPYIKNHKGTAAMKRITDRYVQKLPM